MRTLWLLFVTANLASATGALPVGLIPVKLRCEFAQDPLAVDTTAPRLSWLVEGTARDAKQNAYRILAASSEELLGQDRADLWDSGKVRSDETLHVPYGGKPLASAQRVFWKVKVWDNSGHGIWSSRAEWTMGLLDEKDWRAKWITAKAALGTNAEFQTMLVRREFTSEKPLKRAVVAICGLGQYEALVNGTKAGTDILTPGWTKYDKTCLYDMYDVTSQVRPGKNALGVLLGNGMYNVRGGRYTKFQGSFGPLKVIAQVRLEYTDGSTNVIGTDEQWKVRSGPITFSCVFGGEDYDARLEPRGWAGAGFDETGWERAVPCDLPSGRLRGMTFSGPPIRTFEVLKPIAVRRLRDGVAVYDLGQNVSIIPRVRIKGPAGASIRIVPAELLAQDGSVDRGSCGGGQAYWQYTCAGSGSEDWTPKFFYHGCRYLQVESVSPGAPAEIQSLEGIVVHADCPPVGNFECSNELFNRTRRLVRWAQRSNMMSVMTDCPHREKLGWLEEDHLNGPSLRYEFDMARLFTKVMNDMADSQRPSGLVPDIAPEYVVFQGGFVDSPEWGSAVVLVPWQQYEFAGDLELLKRYYPQMSRYVDYLTTRATGHIVSHGLGDWYDIGPNPPGVAQLTPLPLTATAFYYLDALVLSRAALLLGKAQDADRYAKLAGAIGVAFNTKFLNRETGGYATGSQCANAIPLVMGLVPAEHRAKVVEAIVQDIRLKGNALTAGDVGYRYLLRALAESNRSDVIFDVNNQSEKPGYGYQLKQGATSLTEAWDAGRGSSQNHFMLGQITEWFYRDLAGISSAGEGPGFKHIVINPHPVGDVAWVRASYDSVCGRIAVEWELKQGLFSLNLTIPPNTSATVHLPGAKAGMITESGEPVTKAKGVKYVQEESDRSVLEVGSGQYRFSSHYP